MDRPIIVAGAGSIGCFVGGMLARAGRRVGFLARPRIMTEIEANGLRLSSFEGLDARIETDAINLSQDPASLQGAGIILITVKSDDTPAMAELIARHAPADAIIVSLQNGVGNVGVLREKLGQRPASPIEAAADIADDAPDAERTAEYLSVPGLAVKAHADMTGIQWGKLLVNLNNALNALSNLPLRQQLAQRAWRALLADQIAEALSVMKAAGIAPLSTTPLPASWTPHILRLPDVLFQAVARQMLKIDPTARSSMWEDLQRGRRTEIDHLQGMIVNLAVKHRMVAPLSSHVVGLVKGAEADGKGSPGFLPRKIRGD